jgi:hypothetical protein
VNMGHDLDPLAESSMVGSHQTRQVLGGSDDCTLGFGDYADLGCSNMENQEEGRSMI